MRNRVMLNERETQLVRNLNQAIGMVIDHAERRARGSSFTIKLIQELIVELNESRDLAANL